MLVGVVAVYDIATSLIAARKTLKSILRVRRIALLRFQCENGNFHSKLFSFVNIALLFTQTLAYYRVGVRSLQQYHKVFIMPDGEFSKRKICEN